MNCDKKRSFRIELAALLLKIAGFGLMLSGLIFNKFTASLYDSHPPLEYTTVWGISRAQIQLLVTGLVIYLLSLIISSKWGKEKIGWFLERRMVLELLLLIMTIFLPIFLGEVITRPFTIDHLKKKETSIFIEDPELGWRLRPNAHQFWGGVEVEINGKGLRGPEIPYERDKKSKRILFLGDSVTFGFRLDDYRQTYPYILGEILQKEFSQDMEIINAGVDGYSPWQYYAFLKNEGIKYKPDLIMIGFFLNDVTEKFGLRKFGGGGEGFQLSRSYYSFDDWLQHNSGIYALIKLIQTRIFLGSNPRKRAINLEIMNVGDLAYHPDLREVKEGWKITLNNMGKIIAFCKEHEIPIAIVILPFTFQFKDIPRLSSPQKVLLSYCERKGIPCLDLLPLIDEFARNNSLRLEELFFDHGHLRSRGCEVVARLIADFIEDVPELQKLFNKEEDPKGLTK